MSPPLGALDGRIAAAPISWGICEVPGWGEMMPVDRVLSEMVSQGLTATELGAPGFLPDEPEAINEVLGRHGMTLVGGFVPLVLQDPTQRAEALAQAERTAAVFEACGGTVFVTAAVQDLAWSDPVRLDAEGMKVLGEGLAQVDEICSRHGLVQVLHPHVGTLVETAEDIDLALTHTDVAWCLDTGHLLIGGVDPVEFVRDHADRVKHVHLKDVTLPLVPKVLQREMPLIAAVQEGLFRTLGTGEVPVDEVVLTLESRGYAGWYVLEQDTALTSGLPVDGDGPVEDVEACLGYLRDQVVPRIPAASAL